ncbi:hypothetical protein BJY16_004885 [Actinoplanes octamycinicus]|uniref:Excreted virulence factor EspC (Type VII ESX diderm) n=1 Tax=Actinoplanes octamycinicus TaxID=135948 RepID=A0A7W7GZX9_9ACTN|nr:hypothetical protein [Actinoplanes octamycinicus]MBB4741426.1 hypothetical protein [Actinoplanes octamycinicus]
MPKEHEELGVDLYHLWLAGDKFLPAVAAQFEGARRELFASETADQCFRRPTEFHSGDVGPVLGSLTQLRQMLAGVLQDSAENLHAAGDALKLASEVYAETDLRAARELSDLRDDAGKGEF